MNEREAQKNVRKKYWCIIQLRENSIQTLKENLGKNTSKINDKQHSSTMIWLMNSLGMEQPMISWNYKKLNKNFQVRPLVFLLNILSTISFFKCVNKNGRWKDNWAKKTERYFGIKWKRVTKTDGNSLQIFSCCQSFQML